MNAAYPHESGVRRGQVNHGTTRDMLDTNRAPEPAKRFRGDVRQYGPDDPNTDPNGAERRIGTGITGGAPWE